MYSFKDIESILKTQLLLFNELKKKVVNLMKFFLKKIIATTTKI